jgi:hypothetical protein
MNLPLKGGCSMGLTPVVSLDIAKMYLRVDSADEDELIGLLLLTAERMVMDVSRLSIEEWQEIQTVDILTRWLLKWQWYAERFTMLI